LLEAAADAVGDEIDHAVLEHQHQLAAAAAEMRGGQHAGARRRDQMRDAEGGAEKPGASHPSPAAPARGSASGGSFSSLKPA
jgi:hypothetical protein